jgi:hypothetical protein
VGLWNSANPMDAHTSFSRLLPFAFLGHSMEGWDGVKGSLRRAQKPRAPLTPPQPSTKIPWEESEGKE